MILSWYEQKAVCILLTLLYLGIKNIRLGPTVPAFISANVMQYLVDNYGIRPITTPEGDLKAILKSLLDKQKKIADTNCQLSFCLCRWF